MSAQKEAMDGPSWCSIPCPCWNLEPQELPPGSPPCSRGALFVVLVFPTSHGCPSSSLASLDTSPILQGSLYGIMELFRLEKTSKTAESKL